MTDGCVCSVSRSVLWKQVCWLFNEVWSSRKTLIVKLCSYQRGKKKCIAVNWRNRDGWKKKQQQKKDKCDPLGWFYFRKMREQVHRSKSCTQAHYSATGRTGWSWLGGKISKIVGEEQQQKSSLMHGTIIWFLYQNLSTGFQTCPWTCIISKHLFWSLVSTGKSF